MHASVSLAMNAAAPKAAATELPNVLTDGDGEKPVDDECAPYNINDSKYLSAA